MAQGQPSIEQLHGSMEREGIGEVFQLLRELRELNAANIQAQAAVVARNGEEQNVLQTFTVDNSAEQAPSFVARVANRARDLRYSVSEWYQEKKKSLKVV